MINNILLLMIKFYRDHNDSPKYILISKDRLRDYHREMVDVDGSFYSDFHGLKLISVRGEDRLELA